MDTAREMYTNQWSHVHHGKHLRFVSIVSEDGEWRTVSGVMNPGLVYEVHVSDLVPAR